MRKLAALQEVRNAGEDGRAEEGVRDARDPGERDDRRLALPTNGRRQKTPSLTRSAVTTEALAREPVDQRAGCKPDRDRRAST